MEERLEEETGWEQGDRRSSKRGTRRERRNNLMKGFKERHEMKWENKNNSSVDVKTKKDSRDQEKEWRREERDTEGIEMWESGGKLRRNPRMNEIKATIKILKQKEKKGNALGCSFPADRISVISFLSFPTSALCCCTLQSELHYHALTRQETLCGSWYI